MPDDPSWMTNLGIQMQDVVAGSLGGAVSSLVRRAYQPWEVVTSVAAGTFAGAYFSRAASNYTGVDRLTCAAALGVTGILACWGIIWFGTLLVQRVKGKTNVD